MASVAVILFIGQSFSQFDVKWVANTSVFIFEVGSAICGSAQSSNALVVGRVIAGMGGAGMYLGYVLALYINFIATCLYDRSGADANSTGPSTTSQSLALIKKPLSSTL
jgi:MFS family permease